MLLGPCRPHAHARLHAQVGIISTLEPHWVVLDAELSEIRKDYAALRTVRHAASLIRLLFGACGK